MSDESDIWRSKLRQRWELASVLNFLNVFAPVIGRNLKFFAEEIEMGLIDPNDCLAQLHISLLKGIPPVSKTLHVTDAWMTALSKKLAMWWPWVAEGDFPLVAAKGEETKRYKELDPTVRLMVLKALCEIRADQDDIVSYLNDEMKKGTDISTFRKDKIAGDESGTAYWLDGNAIIGRRLYKEVSTFDSKAKAMNEGNRMTINFQWETLATNLEEFHKVVDEFSSSEVKLEVAVSEVVETDVIPMLEKLEKKKEKALQQQKRQEMLLNGVRNSEVARTCRSRRPVNYTYDDYDKVIEEAIQLTKRRKATEERTPSDKHSGPRKIKETASNGGSEPDTKSRDSESTESESESESENDKFEESDDNDNTDDEYNDKKDDSGNEDESDSSDFENDNSNLKSKKQDDKFTHRPRGSRYSERVAGIAGPTIPEGGNLGAKNRLRQRPTLNTALDSVEAVVSDSEDEKEASIAHDSEDEEKPTEPSEDEDEEMSTEPSEDEDEEKSAERSEDEEKSAERSEDEENSGEQSSQSSGAEENSSPVSDGGDDS